MAAPRLVKLADAMALLACSDETVYRMARAGLIAYLRNPVTGSWRFRVDSIEAYIAANTVPARPPVIAATPATPRRRRSARNSAAAPAQDAPWVGSVFGPRTASGETNTNRAASSAARSTRRLRCSQAP